MKASGVGIKSSKIQEANSPGSLTFRELKTDRPVKLAYRQVPPSVPQLVNPLIGLTVLLLPGWVQEIIVDYFDADCDAYLLVETDYDYRKVAIRVHASWLGLEADERRLRWLHEVAHIVLTPTQDWTKAVMERFVDKESPMGRTILAELNSRVEQTTQDLCEIIRKILPSI